jgi:hypothetical protein
MRFPQHATTILARGTYDQMLERWDVADKRLRAFGLDGHVAVRSSDDPQAMTDVPYSPWPSDRRAKRVPVPSDKPDPVAARLAVLPGDRVKVAKYGNWYVGTVIRSAIKGVTVRFNASTKTGSHIPAHRAERDPRYTTADWCLWCSDRRIERVLDDDRYCQHEYMPHREVVYVKDGVCLQCEKPFRWQHVITGWGGEPPERERRFRIWDGDVLEVRKQVGAWEAVTG